MREGQNPRDNGSTNEEFLDACGGAESQNDGQTMENGGGKKTKANEQWKPPPAATKMSMEPKGCID